MTAVHQQAATDPDGPTGRLATWVADLTLDQVPNDVVERAKHLLLDGLGCALVGAQLPWSRVATDAVLGLEGNGDTLVIGTGQVTSAPAAAVLNGTFIQGFELDDFHPLAPLHSCSLLIPALLSTATTRPDTTGPTTGAELLLAAIAGFEVGPRVGYTLHGTQMLDRGWHSGPGVRHPLGGDGVGQAARPAAGATGGRPRPGRHPVGRPDGRAVRGDEQAHAPRFRGAQRFLRGGSCRGRLHRHQAGVRARIWRISQRFR